MPAIPVQTPVELQIEEVNLLSRQCSPDGWMFDPAGTGSRASLGS